jgi:hypothetical protein
MKNLSLLFAALILMIGKISAQSDVSFFCQDGQKFWVIINGIKQNDVPQTNVKVSGLSASNYKAKIIFDNNAIPAIEKTIFTKQADDKFFSRSYAIKKDKNGNYVMRLNSMDENVVPSGDQYATPLIITEKPATVQTNQTTTTITTNANTTPVNGGGVSINAVDPATGEAVNINMSVNGGNTGMTGGTVTTTTTTTTTSTSSHTTGYHDNDVVQTTHNQPEHYIMQGYSGRIGCPWPMNAGDFQSAKNSISSKSFDDTRLTIAKQVTSANCLFSSQVKEIMLLFSFEATKLDFAKYAYNYVYDQGNYFKLNDAFTFESSIDELNSYINGSR